MTRMIATIAAVSAAAFMAAAPAMAQNTKIDAGGGKGLVVVEISPDIQAELEDIIADNNIVVPATVQLPINVAATVCDVEVNAIASSNDKGDKTCTASADQAETLAEVITTQTQ